MAPMRRRWDWRWTARASAWVCAASASPSSCRTVSRRTCSSKRRGSSRCPRPNTYSPVSELFPAGVDQLFQLGHDRKEVADDSDVGDLEDRGFGILVDGNDGAGILDTRQVLDRAGNTDRDVQFGRDDLAGLAHL